MSHIASLESIFRYMSAIFNMCYSAILYNWLFLEVRHFMALVFVSVCLFSCYCAIFVLNASL